MKCLIFGGGGFIGAALVDCLLAQGHSITVFEQPRVRPFRDFSERESVHWLAGDILNARDVADAMLDVDVIVHLVSTTLPKGSNDNPVFDVQTNLIAALQMLDAMVSSRVKRIVFISSGGTVYGTPHQVPIDEQHPTDPHVSYGITKLAIEKYMALYERMHGINATILRVANPYGERQRVETAQGAVGVFLSRAMQGLPVEIWGDGTITRDYIYVGDVASAIARAITYAGCERVFNVSSGVGTSLNELLNHLEQVLGKAIERSYQPGRPFDVPVSILRNDLARTELAWTPKVSLREGIAHTRDWLASQLTGLE